MSLSNAQRQARWRERHIKGDLFPPISEYEFPKATDRYVTVKVLGVTSPSSVQLLCCPFCGSVPCVYKNCSSYMVEHVIYCKGCEVLFTSVSQSLADLVVKWNRRHV